MHPEEVMELEFRLLDCLICFLMKIRQGSGLKVSAGQRRGIVDIVEVQKLEKQRIINLCLTGVLIAVHFSVLKQER